MSKACNDLPEPVRLWLERVGGFQSAPLGINLQQTGVLRLKPAGRWVSFQASQFFTIDHPSSDWRAQVKMAPGIYLHGHDQWHNGKGRMQMHLWRFIPVVRASGANIDQGAMVRFLAEMVWFPWAALKSYISWEAVSKYQVKATLTYQNNSVTGIYDFNEAGDVRSFQAKRYYSQGKTGSFEDWLVEIDPAGYRDFNGIRLPSKASVSWLLPGGRFTWLQLQISQVKNQ